jgi:hypothetical protein
MRLLFATALLAAPFGLAGCCFCNNPFAVAALESREDQLAAEVADLKKSVRDRAARVGPRLREALPPGSGLYARGVSTSGLAVKWTSRHAGTLVKGEVTNRGVVMWKGNKKPAAPGGGSGGSESGENRTRTPRDDSASERDSSRKSDDEPKRRVRRRK